MESENTAVEDENLLSLDTLKAELDSPLLQLITTRSQQQIGNSSFTYSNGITIFLKFNF